MSARFRIRTKEGQELSFASREVFAEFVRSGDLSPDDVVYDAETREWSSARTHPVVLQIELEAEEALRAAAGEPSPRPEVTEAEAEAEEQEPEETDEPQAPAAELDFDLAPAQDGLTPEEQAAAFVAKMEAERESERDLDEDLPGFKMERGASSVVEELAAAPHPEPPPSPAPRAREPAPRRARSSGPTAVPSAPKKKRKKKKPGSGAVRKYAPFAILGAAAVAAGVYFGPEVLSSVGGGAAAAPDTTAPPLPPPEIASTEEAVRQRARERFLTATQNALRGLDEVPDVWLRGSYLASPSDYPEVRAVWEQYVITIRDVRAGDDARYREAYGRALDDARILDDSARTARLAGATAAFRAAVGPRAMHYDRVEALALAAIRGHDALVQAEGTIMYQPATGPALSADPVIEAVGRSPAAQDLLNQVLDAILAELQAEGGPREARNVREWVWDGILDAVTS